jgi:hypothetical protein
MLLALRVQRVLRLFFVVESGGGMMTHAFDAP